MLNATIKFFLENKLVTVLVLVGFIIGGLITAPFDWKLDLLPRDPVPVDAIPDIGENQQIIFTPWEGRSSQDIEDQITYPLTTSLLGIPGVRTIRSTSMFGFSSIYVIFEDNIEFYWSRSRILEKLNSLPSGTLPEGVQPALGPDATALGQIFWYTLEGRDPQGNPTGGWDLHELRSIQDFQVRYALTSAQGVSEVASIGGYVKEYQIDVDPVALQKYNIPLSEVMMMVRNGNIDVGAHTIEINQAEYMIRGLGYIQSIEDIEDIVLMQENNVPVRIKDVARVNLGPQPRRGILDKAGAEAVGGVVVARYGANPLAVIQNVKEKIAEIQAGLPSKTLDDGTLSRVTVVPFYDRTHLIYETLGTLNEALMLQILITIIVIMIMVMNLRASILISALLPVAILMCFIAMRFFGVDANIVSLSGIAIAIGTLVDLGIIMSENMIRHLQIAPKGQRVITTIYNATTQVATAILTAVSTTIVSFLPVFTLQAAEGKLFTPLAFTKTFALVAALIISLFIIPAFAHWLFSAKISRQNVRRWVNITMIGVGAVVLIFTPYTWAGIFLVLIGLATLAEPYYPSQLKPHSNLIITGIVVLTVVFLLTRAWMPLGPGPGMLVNFFFIALILIILLSIFYAVIHYYEKILGWCLDHKAAFLSIPAFLVLLGFIIWVGFGNVFGFVANGFDRVGMDIKQTKIWSDPYHAFPGIGKEFMPSLDEGSYLLMPTTMPHAGVEQVHDYLRILDMAVAAIPEVENVVGKAGRVESALDPAPINMYENVILYKPEYATDASGNRIRYRIDDEDNYVRDENGELIPDDRGQYFRNWRDHIKSPDDIWSEIVKVTNIAGLTSAPKLQPIETRLVMLQTGMRAPMGMKVRGPDLKTIEEFAIQLGQILEQVPSVKAEAVFAERTVGKPYIEIDIDRKAIGRYGLSVQQVQEHIEVALGGMPITTTVEGRERYPVRVRYPRELRDDPESISRILIATPTGAQVPLGQLAEINFVEGPEMIRSEETFLTNFVLFDKRKGFAEVDVVNDAQKAIDERISSGELVVPAGVSYVFSGNYENQVRAEKRLAFIVPIVLLVIFLILYFQFKSVPVSLIIFSGIAVALNGGFLMIWLYGQPWFADFSLFGTEMRGLFQMGVINLSVAVWVGFIALFGIATDDGVVISTYIQQVTEESQPSTVEEVRAAVIEGGSKRIRPSMMTTATTIIALLPVLTSTGRGADLMVPMAIPIVGGMAIAIITVFVVPVLYSLILERRVK